MPPPASRAVPLTLPGGAVERANAPLAAAHADDLDALSARLARRGVDVGAVVGEIAAFEVAVPSWAFGTGGTRFGRFPGAGEPLTVLDKLDDAAAVHALTGAAPRVSLHLPWDAPTGATGGAAGLREHAAARGLGFDAVNSNTFQDQAGQARSYKFGSLAHTDAGVRRQAIDHNLAVIETGAALGSAALTVWLADGTSFPGQASLRGQFARVEAALGEIYAGLPTGWRLFTEHKPYEPAFYATVVQDWGASLMLAQALGPRAACLVDLGHHLPNTNVELVVARLLHAGRLGGFHFNDSAYGDDDLTTGSLRPYRLFLVFHELAQAARDALPGFDPAYMIDQSHNLKDPIEDLLQTVDALQTAYAQALLVDAVALAAAQDANDVVMAERCLQTAFRTDVAPLVAEARRRRGAALDPVGAFRASGYRAAAAQARAGGAYAPPQAL